MRRLFAALLPLLLLGAAPAPLPVEQPEVIATFPHDSTAFTEGLIYLDGRLFESTGLEGQSVVREVRLEDGKVLREAAIDARYFGEGLVDWKNRLISLTWQHGIGFIWDRATFRKIGTFRYRGEGWSLTRNDREIVMSDGTPFLRFLDPETLKEKRRIQVTADGRPVPRLNELEWVKGEVFANIWLTDRIARIDPVTGKVKGWIDVSALSAASGRRGRDDVANGIAYDSRKDRLFVTGKNWPVLYQIRLAR
jgi:glutamine cyclotransferase